MITFAVRGSEQVQLHLLTRKLKVRDALREAVTRSAIMLTAYVKEEKLSGQVLKNQTGTLRRKINYKVTATDTAVSGSVGVKVSYAAAHEYGFDGTVTVREHLRRVKSHVGTTTVHGYSRHMHLPERSFLRSSLRENAEPILLTLRAAVTGAME